MVTLFLYYYCKLFEIQFEIGELLQIVSTLQKFIYAFIYLCFNRLQIN